MTLLSLGAVGAIANPAPVQPRIGVGYNSSSGGYDGFSHLDAFYPLLQTPGHHLLYTYGQLRMDGGTPLGTNLMLGYRIANPQTRRVWGAYLGYDQQNTGTNSFQQLGLGLESLGDWDLRINGYLPLGQTRKLALDTGLQITDHYFRDHDLNLVLQRQQIYESAAQGVDVEVGTRLFNLGTGELRGYGGLYYYKPTGSEGSLGYRLRLTVDPVPGLNMGLNFQNDRLFGSHLAFQVGAHWGGARPSQDPDRLLTRLEKTPQRTQAIAIEQQTTVAFNSTVVATNPETGQPWYFLHVHPDGGQDGRFESPFATVEEAIGSLSRSAVANKNTIVYVQNVRQPATTTVNVPENVRLWSTGPLQRIDTREMGNVILPLSQSGIFPHIHTTVNMRSGSHLAGFTIQPAEGDNGVTGNQVRDLIIRENRITTTGDHAVAVNLNNVSGTMTLTANQINTSGDSAHGVSLQQTEAHLTAATLTGNQISTSGNSAHGFYTRTRNDQSRIDQITLTGNQLATQGEKSHGLFAFIDTSSVLRDLTIHRSTATTQANQAHGIFAFARTGGRIENVFIHESTARTEGNQANGIILFANEAGSRLDRVTLSHNQVSTAGINAAAVLTFASKGGHLGQSELTANTITTTGNGSVALLSFASNRSSLGNTTITDNQIQTSGINANGILAFATTESNLNSATISGNTVTTLGQGGGAAQGLYNSYAVDRSGGILAFASNGSTVNQATVTGNQVNTQGTLSNGIAVFASRQKGHGASRLEQATVENNRVTTTGQESHGILTFASQESTLTTATISGNTSITSGDQAYGLFGFAANSQNFGGLTLRQNLTQTTGQNAHGTFIFASNNGQIAALDIFNNRNSTTGQGADGIKIQATGDHSILPMVTVQNNTITTQGTNANGISTMLERNTALTTANLSENRVAIGGNGGRAIALTLNHANLTSWTASRNNLTTGGDGESGADRAPGIFVFSTNSDLENVILEHNQIKTTGLGSIGIDVTAAGGSFNRAVVENNQVMTAGANYVEGTVDVGSMGISFSALNGTTFGEAIATGNQIITQNTKAHGIQFLTVNSTIENATTTNNMIRTHGAEAHGIFLLATQNNQGRGEITNANITQNRIHTENEAANGIFALAALGTLDTLNLNANQINTRGDRANGIFTLATEGTIHRAIANGNNIRTLAANSNGILFQASNNGQIHNAQLINNMVPQAGLHSFHVQTSTGVTLTNPSLCVAAFSGNNSPNPSATDLRVTHAAGTINFVNFTNVAANNTSFSNILANGGGTFNGAVADCP
ncbi:MAG: hypothetical protein EA366_13985 [Spirulina sp. DLM2.Bin59]|nr:MAG: hypothetical protein EA366_13985 [Spirulina sp. DLM2.Bin59]